MVYVRKILLMFYSEIIDWDAALIDWDERLLIELRNHLVDISPSKIFQMRQQGALLYNMYFSSIDQIIQTTFEIIRERIFPELKRDRSVWNSKPGKFWIIFWNMKYSSILRGISFDLFRRRTSSFTWRTTGTDALLCWSGEYCPAGQIYRSYSRRSNRSQLR